MLREYRLQTWFWWTTIAACGLSFVLALGPARAAAAPHATARELATRVSVRAGTHSGSAPQSALSAPRVRTRVAEAPAALEPAGAVAPAKPVVRRLRRLATSEVSPEMLVVAQRLIREHHQDRPGTEIPFEVAGKRYLARVERHYHPEGGPVKPWGYHPGISLLSER